MNGRERVEELYCAIQAAASGVVTWESMKTKGDALIRDLDRDIRWRPIGEAPKDGSEVLGWARGYGHSFITYEPDCYAFTNRNGDTFPATHFAFITPPEEP